MSVPSTIVKFSAIPGIHKAYVDYGYDLTTDIVVSFKHYTEGYRLTRRSSYSLSGVNVTHAELQALAERHFIQNGDVIVTDAMTPKHDYVVVHKEAVVHAKAGVPLSQTLNLLQSANGAPLEMDRVVIANVDPNVSIKPYHIKAVPVLAYSVVKA